MKSRYKSSAILACSYAVSQGSIFSLNILVAWFLGSERLGEIILLTSMISFAYQFCDLGNQTVMANCVAKENYANYSHLLFSRAALALVFCTAFSWYSHESMPIGTFDDYVYVAIPFLGVLQATQVGALHERNSKYSLVVLPQVIFWLGVTFSIAAAVYFMNAGVAVFGAIIFSLMGGAASFIAIDSNFKKIRVNFLPTKNSFHEMLSVMFGPMLSQMWGRGLVIYISSISAMQVVGGIGLAKNIQVAICLCLGFYCRPIFVGWIGIFVKNDNSIDANRWGLLGRLIRPAVLSLLGPILYLIVNFDSFPFASEYRAGFFVLLSIPFWFGALVAGQLIYINLKPNKRMILDLLALSSNAVTFYLLRDFDIVEAVAYGEMVQSMVLVTFSVFLLRKKIESTQ